MSAPPVPTDVRLRMGHALLQHLADSSCARVLHIKGAALSPRLAAGRSVSSDCDVLVHPDDVAAFTAALEKAGWEPITSFEHGSVFEHAATYYNRVWGTVDVHRTFPGLERDARLSFETLWGPREAVELGGVACTVPSLQGQRLLLLLHAARDHMGRRSRDVEAAWDAAAPPEREDLDTLADALGATVPLALVTGRPERARGLPGEHVWRAVAGHANATEVWRARIRDARRIGPAATVRVLRRALRVNPDHLAVRLDREPSRREIRREWIRRWGRGARRLREGRRRR